jgi:hypothetical protein
MSGTGSKQEVCLRSTAADGMTRAVGYAVGRLWQCLAVGARLIN